MSPDEINAFVGENSSYYMQKWKDSYETGWNWSAAFFSIEWMVYRKMYIEAMLYLLLQVAIIVGLPLLIFSQTGIFSPIGGRGFISILCGALGNWLYLKKAQRVVRKIKTSHQKERLGILQRKGGTSILGMGICLILEAIVVVVPNL